MTPNIKLIAIDLDDTLLHDDISLSAYTKGQPLYTLIISQP